MAINDPFTHGEVAAPNQFESFAPKGQEKGNLDYSAHRGYVAMSK